MKIKLGKLRKQQIYTNILMYGDVTVYKIILKLTWVIFYR